MQAPERGSGSELDSELEPEPKLEPLELESLEPRLAIDSSFTALLLLFPPCSPITNNYATNENLPPNVIKQLAKELKNLNETPPEGIKVGVNDDNFSVIYADIEGPAGTPYENGVFRMKLILSHDFPQSPPKGYFLTKIFHPNIATNGEICVNALKKDWNPSLGLRHVLIVIRCLLIEPFPESALNEQAGKMLLEDYDEYARHASQSVIAFDNSGNSFRISSCWALHWNTRSQAEAAAELKTGAISESTTVALNVDQTTTSAKCADQKNTVSGAAQPPLPSPLAPKPENGQDYPAAMPSSAETGVSGSKAVLATLKKEAGLSKVPADKKKIDARKKSLKRL
ncbi:hypothetical protein DH2020_018711 [Rehmannia glutinosa]|uniref:UBC core domain-containing protein n=1 Tax=Rehmannia glutinosa TaxID=99300 RepID=A0ABR0WNS2_REHGL